MTTRIVLRFTRDAVWTIAIEVMKGVFVHEQVEFRVETAKDPVVQGDTLPCSFRIKNHSSVPKTISGLCCEIVYGKVKAESNSGEPLFAHSFSDDWQLGSGEDKTASFEVSLDRNFPITDKTNSPLFRFGAAGVRVTEIPLVVGCHPHIEALLGILESSFQFVRKGEKWSKGWVEAKLKPSSSRRLSMVNELVLGFRFEGDDLAMRFKFNVKKFESAESAVKIGKGKTEVVSLLEASKYLQPGGFLDHAAVEAAIDAALSEVATGL